jgi:hypothetical protein
MFISSLHHFSFISVMTQFKSWSPDQYFEPFTSPQMQTWANITVKYVIATLCLNLVARQV